MNFLLRLIIINVLSVHALTVFTIFCLLVVEKIKLKVLACSSEIPVLTNSENPLVTRFKYPKAAILTLKMLAGSRLWFCNIIPEADCDELTLAPFAFSQWEVGTGEHRPITEKGVLRRISVYIFKINNSKKWSKKLINVKGSEKLLKDLENHKRTQRMYRLNCLELIKYPSRGTVHLNAIATEK